MTALSDVLDPLTITHWFRAGTAGPLQSTGDVGGISLGSGTSVTFGSTHPVTGEYSIAYDGSASLLKSAISTGTINTATGSWGVLFKTNTTNYTINRTVVDFSTAGGAVAMTLFFAVTSGDFTYRIQNTFPTNHYTLTLPRATLDLTDDQWHNVWIIQDGTPAMYVDGVDVTASCTVSQAGSVASTEWWSNNITRGAARLGVGAFGGTVDANYFKGFVADPIMTTAVLSASDITDIWNAYAGIGGVGAGGIRYTGRVVRASAI